MPPAGTACLSEGVTCHCQLARPRSIQRSTWNFHRRDQHYTCDDAKRVQCLLLLHQQEPGKPSQPHYGRTCFLRIHFCRSGSAKISSFFLAAAALCTWRMHVTARMATTARTMLLACKARGVVACRHLLC